MDVRVIFTLSVFSIICAHPISNNILIPGIHVATQYHAQNNLGLYNYGYATGTSAKSESRSLDGITRGAYSYLDANGKLQNVHYTADSLNGFRVVASNLPVDRQILPQPVQDTPEVQQVKAAHLNALEEAKLQNSVIQDSVQDTPEVQQAKAAHFAAIEKAKLLNNVVNTEQNIQYTTPYSSFSYAYNTIVPKLAYLVPTQPLLATNYFYSYFPVNQQLLTPVAPVAPIIEPAIVNVPVSTSNGESENNNINNNSSESTSTDDDSIEISAKNSNDNNKETNEDLPATESSIKVGQ